MKKSGYIAAVRSQMAVHDQCKMNHALYAQRSWFMIIKQYAI